MNKLTWNDIELHIVDNDGDRVLPKSKYPWQRPYDLYRTNAVDIVFGGEGDIKVYANVGTKIDIPINNDIQYIMHTLNTCLDILRCTHCA